MDLYHPPRNRRVSGNVISRNATDNVIKEFRTDAGTRALVRQHRLGDFLALPYVACSNETTLVVEIRVTLRRKNIFARNTKRRFDMAYSLDHLFKLGRVD